MTADQQVIHEPRCNTMCRPGAHYLTAGIGYPHIHRTDLDSECGACVAALGVTEDVTP